MAVLASQPIKLLVALYTDPEFQILLHAKYFTLRTQLFRHPHQPLQPRPHISLKPQWKPPKINRKPPRRPRQHHSSTLPLQHHLHYILRHRLRLQHRIEPRILRCEVPDQRRAREPLRHEDRPHARRVVPRGQFRRETLMEGQRGGFGGRVVHHVGGGGVAALRGDGHDHAVVGCDQGGHELAREMVVREGVDFEEEAGLRLGAAEDGAAAADAGVVDEDGGRAEGGADGGCR